MRICVLHSSYDLSHSAFKDHDARVDPLRYLAGHDVEIHGIHKATAVAQVRDLVARGFEVYLNLCDGAWDEDRAGIEVVQALERLGAAYTGADERFYDPTREEMKLACHYAGIDTPRFVHAVAAAEAPEIAAVLRFPLLVKHPQSYGSIGMTRDSRVTDAAALEREIARMCAAYGGALVEEFVEGREFTVLVAEPGEGESAPRTYVPVEVRFPEGETFKHFDLKWIDFRSMSWVPVTDAALAARLRDVSAGTFSAIGGVGYGRCDLRMAADGRIHVLEINPNCALFLPPGEFGSADEILALDPQGHRSFTDHVVQCAVRRRDARRPRTSVRYHPARGWGLRAACDLGEGEIVHRHEEAAHHLVSKAHAGATWDDVRLRWLAQYAWPLTDDVFVMWSDRPSEWRPIDHSCDPNSWLVGLDLVARRAIRGGEAVTMDYATFCGPAMESFRCHCGASACRGTIRGTDHLLPEVGERYDGHLSDWVRRARANFAARRGRRRNVACSTSRNTT